MILRILKVFTAIAIFANVSITLAANIHHFNVKVNPTKVTVGEAIDLTIDAVDKNDEIITDYEWTILIFSESDKLAEFPNSIEDNTFTFWKSNEWTVKFENAVKFTKAWKQDIHVYDLDDQTDSVLWIAEVEVTKKTVEQNINIEIISPQNGLTVWKNTIRVSWKTNKNHQIKIIINNKWETLTTTNKDWLFEKEIDWIEKWENIIKAYVLNSEWKEIWASKKIIITSDPSVPVLNKIKLSPENEVEAGTKMTAEVYATKKLEEVSIIVNESLNILKEDSEWIYKWEFLAPKEEWEYKIDVLLKDELWHKVEEKEKLILKVTPVLNVAVEVEKKEIKKIENNSKDKCKVWDFSGDVFDWKCWEKPEDYNSPVDLWIKNLKIVQLKTKSVLTWDKLEDAIKYEVYKKMVWDELELIDTVELPKYEVNMIWNAVKYEYFAVKAIWNKEFFSDDYSEKIIEKEIKWDLSEAVKIQTWTKEIILIIIALLLWLGVFIFSIKKA